MLTVLVCWNVQYKRMLSVLVCWTGQYTRVLSVLVSQAGKRILSEENKALCVPSGKVCMTLLEKGHSCCWYGA
jgi:hypothetical protein